MPSGVWQPFKIESTVRGHPGMDSFPVVSRRRILPFNSRCVSLLYISRIAASGQLRTMACSIAPTVATLERSCPGIDAACTMSSRSGSEIYGKEMCIRDRERTLSIIQEMAKSGKLNPAIISVIQENFDEIVDEVAENCSPALENYYGIQLEYRRLLTRYLE